jgi:hypothetical protein
MKNNYWLNKSLSEGVSAYAVNNLNKNYEELYVGLLESFPGFSWQLTFGEMNGAYSTVIWSEADPLVCISQYMNGEVIVSNYDY